MKVAVFGDRMLDCYYVGTAERISPEAPIPVVKIDRTFDFPGGAGNVVANLEALGVEVFDYTTPGPIKSRVMVGDVQIARFDIHDYCKPADPKGCEDVSLDAVVVADYGKGSITKELINVINNLQVPVFVDTKKDPNPWSGIATAVFPNIKEYYEFQIQYDYFNGLVVLKRSGKGLSIIQGFCVNSHLDEDIDSPAQAKFVKSVNGAGDTVMAAFVYKYLEDYGRWHWESMLKFANAAAAIAVEHSYTYAPTLQEVEERYYGPNRV